MSGISCFGKANPLHNLAHYAPQGNHKSTSKMVDIMAEIHVHGNDPSKGSAGSIQKTIIGILTDKVDQSKTGKNFGTALAKLKTEITNSNKLGNGSGSVQDRALCVIRGIEMKLAAEPGLHHEMSQHVAFGSFDTSETWRLVLDKYQQPARGEYGFENESGYMSGTFNGLKRALESVRNDEPLSLDLFKDLHDTCVDNVIPMGKTVGDNDFLESGMRDKFKADNVTERRVGFTLTDGRNMTQDGLGELREKIRNGDNWFEILTNNDKPLLKTFARTTAECELRATSIINAYHVEIGNATTEDEKLTAIARCCRDLEVSHLFADGNARTIGFCVVNKLLLENDLSPVILENPNRFDGYSIEELVDEIRQGQQNFAGYCNGPVITVGTGDEGLNNLARLI